VSSQERELEEFLENGMSFRWDGSGGSVREGRQSSLNNQHRSNSNRKNRKHLSRDDLGMNVRVGRHYGGKRVPLVPQNKRRSFAYSTYSGGSSPAMSPRTPSLSFPKRHHFTGLNVREHRSSQMSRNNRLSALQIPISELLRPNKEMRTVWHYMAIVWNYISQRQIKVLFKWTLEQFAMRRGYDDLPQQNVAHGNSGNGGATRHHRTVFKWISLLLDAKDIYGYTPFHIILYHYHASDNLTCLLQLLTEHDILLNEYFQMGVLLHSTPIGDPDRSRAMLRKIQRRKKDLRLSGLPGTPSARQRQTSESTLDSVTHTSGVAAPQTDVLSTVTDGEELSHNDVLSSTSDFTGASRNTLAADAHQSARAQHQILSHNRTFRNESFIQQYEDVKSYTFRWTYKPFGGTRKASRKAFVSKYTDLYATLKEYLHLMDSKKVSKKKVQKFLKNTNALPSSMKREWAEVLLDVLHGYLLVYCEDPLFLAASFNDVLATRQLLDVQKEEKPNDDASTQNSTTAAASPYIIKHNFLKHAIYEHVHHPKVIVEAAAQAMHQNHVETFQEFLMGATEFSLGKALLGPVLNVLNSKGSGGSIAVPVVPHLQSTPQTDASTPPLESEDDLTSTNSHAGLKQITKEFIANIDRISSNLGTIGGNQRHHSNASPALSHTILDVTNLLLDTEHAIKEEITFLGELFSDEEPEMHTHLESLFLEPVSLIFDKISFPLKNRFAPLQYVSGDRMEIEICTLLDVACMHGFMSAVECALTSGLTPTEDHLLLALASDHQDIAMRLIEREGVIPGEKLLLLACMINATDVARVCLRFTSGSYAHVYLAIKHRYTELSDMFVRKDNLFEETIAACVELGSIKYLERYYSEEIYEEQRLMYDASVDIQRALELRCVAIAEYLFLQEKKLNRRSHEYTIICSCVLYDNFEALRKFMDHLLFDGNAYARQKEAVSYGSGTVESSVSVEDDDLSLDHAPLTTHLESHNVLYMCAQSGRTHLLRFIIEHPLGIECTSDMFGVDFSVLHVAAQHGHQQLLQYLLEELFNDFYNVNDLMGEDNVKRFCECVGMDFSDIVVPGRGAREFISQFMREVEYDGQTVLDLAHDHRSVREYLGRYLESEEM